MSERDTALALMVYETWLLNNCSDESLPPVNVRRWVNKQLKRRLFPTDKQQARGRGREMMYLCDVWHAARQGWRIAGPRGVWHMWHGFVPRIWLNRRRGDEVHWDDRELQVYIGHIERKGDTAS